MSKQPSNRLPIAVGKLLEHPHLKQLQIAKHILTNLCRLEIDRQKEHSVPEDSMNTAVNNVVSSVKNLLKESYPKVINATGVLLHTGLGRAPLPIQSLTNMDNSSCYCLLELDLATGKRGDRWAAIEKKLSALFQCESAIVTNNCASAFFLTLAAIANKREVIISRSELVEIGGSFRMPDVISSANVKRVEVGTTNRVRVSDYENAISSKTAAIVKVHPSNYRIVGFTESPTLVELASLSRKYSLPLIEDLGNGLLLPLHNFDVPDEPTVYESIESGVDIVTFSGDKCLGGPQSGIILGKKSLLTKLRKHPLLRVVRPCKLTLASLDGVVTLWMQNKQLEIPFVRMLATTMDELHHRANTICNNITSKNFQCVIDICEGWIGSGSVPLKPIQDVGIVIHSKKISTHQFAKLLRNCIPSIIPVVQNEKVFLHMRTIRDDEVPVVIYQLNHLTQ